MASRKMITAVAAAKHFTLVHVFVQILMFWSRNLVTAEQCVILFYLCLCVRVCARYLYLHVAAGFIAHTF